MASSVEGPSGPVVSRWIVALDYAALIAASAAAARVRPPLTPGALVAAAIAAAAWYFGARAVRHYGPFDQRSARGDVALTAVLLAGVVALLAALAWGSPRFAAAVDVGAFALVAALGIASLRLATNWARRRQPAPENVLVLGVGPLGRHTGLDLRDDPAARRVLVGYLRFDHEPSRARLPAPVLGAVAELERVLKERVVDEVYLAGSDVAAQRAEMQRSIATCERFGVPFALPVASFRFGRAEPVHAYVFADGYVHYLSVQHKPVQLALKRAIDIVLSALALVALAPLFAVVAAAIRLSSPGPVFFRQERVGRRGARFAMLKFRTMVPDAEERKAALLAQNEQSGPVFKMARDPRVIPVGRFLRKYSIDELPQLVNVLRGDMSLVGPRPPVPAEVARYEGWQRRRLSVRPGITCLWQVSGRNAISFEEWMYLDMQYIDHWSLAWDFQLLARTIPAVISGRGAS